MQTRPGGGGGEVIRMDTTVECDTELLEPLTVTLYMPVDVEDIVATVRMELLEPPERIPTFEGEIETVGPVGETVAASFTVPLNPFRLVTLMVEEPVLP